MSKTLVAYFSASGQTEILARSLAGVVGGDLHEIQPLEIYTEEDLDWRNQNSRSSIEMKNLSFRPPIKNKVSHMEEYETIYIGFPIWWYIAPTIINTFLESYSLEGKTIIPFATSGGSGMGKTNQELEKSCQGAILKKGKIFSPHVSVEELKKWLNTL